jgi:hypothetical protein
MDKARLAQIGQLPGIGLLQTSQAGAGALPGEWTLGTQAYRDSGGPGGHFINVLKLLAFRNEDQ